MSTLDIQPQSADTSLPSTRIVRLVFNALVVGLWLWLYRPIFDYLAIIFTREDFRTNQIVLIAIVILIGMRLRRSDHRLRLDIEPHLAPLPLSLALGGSLAYLLVERFLDINTLSAGLFGLATYGLLGLWLAPRPWRQGLPAALLLIGALPFGEHLQTFVGYPLRILTAGIVRDGLGAAGVGSVGIDTILVLENGVSHIDLPCSGIKSLWTGALFLIAATWIERRPINLRWLLSALIFAGLLFAANLARVSLLVVVGQVAGWPLAAEMLHVPLGVLGFVAACLGALGLLRLQKPLPPLDDERERVAQLTRPPWLLPGLAVAIVAMGLLYSPRPHTGLTTAPLQWAFPPDLVTEPMPLTPDEFEWLTRDGAESADRHRFEWRGLTGSMILITSSTWRGHHRPERCFEVYGLSLEDSQTQLINPDFPLRVVSLGYGDKAAQLSAVYWFQSAHRTTDDYATRMWADLDPGRERWVLVSMLFDDHHDPAAGDLSELYTALHQAVAEGLTP
ncbi:MAG: exosortase O [Anaerolineaceae bacterium]|nr:exosortase O [Anaerolineaceae bacterium]MCB9101018.1 exosortase O [Anaerolineales bacterium]